MKVGFALEYSLGHTTHAQNFKLFLDGDSTVDPTYIDLPYHNTPGLWSRLPGVRSNWSLRASLRAYLALRPYATNLQACLFHTQVTSLFSAGLMRKLPSVISLDATPLQYDALGQFYGHTPSTNRRVEAVKKRINIRAFESARKLVTWSEWTKESLVNDYQVPAAKISVIPPGIDTEKWKLPPNANTTPDTLNLLFVGGDFERKGGVALMEAFRIASRSVNGHLHLVTKADVMRDGVPNVTVYRAVAPNSDVLLNLFRKADIFIFPTLGDCLPLAIMEALAAGRPIITTSVGALPEAVTHGETGLIVPPGDAEALAAAIITLAEDPGLRNQLGRRGREVAIERFDAKTNYTKLIDVVKSVAR